MHVTMNIKLLFLFKSVKYVLSVAKILQHLNLRNITSEGRRFNWKLLAVPSTVTAVNQTFNTDYELL